MKAIAYHHYGSPDVLEYVDTEKPVPGDDEVLIRVRAASLNPFDRYSMLGKPFIARLMMGLRKPKLSRLGVDVAGEIEAVGKNVTRFKLGDAVFGASRGSFAEYVCTPASAVALKPANISFEQAASANIAGITALQGIRDYGRVQAGQRVLINGAAGGVGSFAVQIAKSFGAEVTGVCSTKSVDMVRSIGADHVVDYSRDDFTRGGSHYDVMFDCVGSRPVTACRRILNPKGIYVLVGGPFARFFEVLALLPFASQKFALCRAKRSGDDLQFLRELMEAGKVTPFIDRWYALANLAEAMRYVGESHARGKVVITP